MKISSLYTLFVSFNLIWILPAYAMDNKYVPFNEVDFIFGSNFDSEDTHTDLHSASAWNELDSVKYWIDNGKSVDLPDNNGNTPLIMASRGSATAVVKFLLSQKANVNICNNKKKTPLMYAAHAGNEDILKLLFEHEVSTNNQDHNGKTALMFAAQCGHLHIMHMLLNYKKSRVNRVNELVSQKKLVLPRPNTNYPGSLTAYVNIFSRKGTALDLAARYGHVDCFELLLSHGAALPDSLTIPTKDITKMLAFYNVLKQYKKS